MKKIVIADTEFEPESNSTIVLGETDFGANVKVQVARVKPGEEPRPHVHKIRTEMAQIISGQGEIIMNDQVVTDRLGELVLAEPGDVHTLINKGKEDLVVMVVRVNDPGDQDMIYVDKEETNE